jgi:hypothetical protein
LNCKIMSSNNKAILLLAAIVIIIGGIVLGVVLHKSRRNNNSEDVITDAGVNISNLKKEKFDNNCPCNDPTPYAEYKTIISASAGVSYPIEFYPSTDNEKYYNVKYYNQKSGSYAYLTVVAASADGNSPVLSLSDGGPILTVGAKNISNNDSQLWKIVKVPSTTQSSTSSPLSSTDTPGTTAAGTPSTTAAGTPSTTAPRTTSAATTTTTASNLSADKYYFISKIYPGYALQYEDGYLSIRAQGTYENQYWILSRYTYDIGVDTLPNEYVNTPLDARNIRKSRSGPGINSGDINSVNQQKLDNVLQLITSSLQKLNVANNNNSSSAFGYSVDNPIKINLSMGGGVSASNTEAFTDTSNSTNTTNDIISLLDKYENTKSNNSNSIDALTELIANNGGCQALDMSKYTSKRVGQCNCNLSD